MFLSGPPVLLAVGDSFRLIDERLLVDSGNESWEYRYLQDRSCIVGLQFGHKSVLKRNLVLFV